MKSIYNSILVPFDFSERARAALEESFNLARMTGLEITLFHVIRDNQGLFAAFGFERSKSMKKDYENQVRAQLQEVAADASKNLGVKVNAVVSHGKVYDKVLKGTHLLNSKFIVQGINSEKPGTGKDQIGSNALKVIKKAECPVITVKNPHSVDGCRSILVPLDLSKETRQKVGHAMEMAKLFGSTIKVVSVYYSAGDAAVLARLRQQMNQVVKFIKKEGIACSSRIIEEKGSSKILAPRVLEYARKEKDVDLIMIMTQGESELFDLFLGSSAQHIITHSEVPVMTIIPRELGFASMIN